MRRRTFVRDLIGTIFLFIVLLGVVAAIVVGERLLENFKSH